MCVEREVIPLVRRKEVPSHACCGSSCGTRAAQDQPLVIDFSSEKGEDSIRLLTDGDSGTWTEDDRQRKGETIHVG